MLLLPRFRGQALGAIVEGFASPGMKGVAARAGLPASYGDIAIEGIEIDPEADSARLLSRHDGRTRSHERVEHDVPTPRDVPDGVGDHQHWLHGRMRREQLVAVCTERVQAP